MKSVKNGLIELKAFAPSRLWWTWSVPWVPETFLARSPVSVKSLWWPPRKASRVLLAASAYGRRYVGLRANTENSRRQEKPLVPRVPDKRLQSWIRACEEQALEPMAFWRLYSGSVNVFFIINTKTRLVLASTKHFLVINILSSHIIYHGW